LPVVDRGHDCQHGSGVWRDHGLLPHRRRSGFLPSRDRQVRATHPLVRGLLSRSGPVWNAPKG
jgi:hypothetical protein